MEDVTPKLGKVIAVDFDGCICENKWPNIGKPREAVIHALKQEMEKGTKLILWTCREGKFLNEAVGACKAWGLEFDAVNENIPDWVEGWEENPRKVGATEYWDDRAYNPVNDLNDVKATFALFNRIAELEIENTALKKKIKDLVGHKWLSSEDKLELFDDLFNCYCDEIYNSNYKDDFVRKLHALGLTEEEIRDYLEDYLEWEPKEIDVAIAKGLYDY